MSANFLFLHVNLLAPLEPRKRAHSPLLAVGLASESENEKLPYGEDSPWLAAGRLPSPDTIPISEATVLAHLIRHGLRSAFGSMQRQVVDW